MGGAGVSGDGRSRVSYIVGMGGAGIREDQWMVRVRVSLMLNKYHSHSWG